MGKQDIFKTLYFITWMCFASYYYWGVQEVTVTDPIDESGWVPDGAYASRAAALGVAGEPED